VYFKLSVCGFGFQVMKTFVQFGGPPNILVDGKPHLGTDKLVPLLRNFRHHLKELGVSATYVSKRRCSFVLEAPHGLMCLFSVYRLT
jgi:hypothetical protein